MVRRGTQFFQKLVSQISQEIDYNQFDNYQNTGNFTAYGVYFLSIRKKAILHCRTVKATCENFLNNFHVRAF